MSCDSPSYWENVARRAYKAYGRVTDFKNYQGLPMPSWNDLTPKIKEAWIAAVKEAFETAINLHP